MTSIHLDPATLAVLIHELNEASDNDRSVHLRIDTDGLTVTPATDAQDATSEAASGPTLRTHLNLSVDLLPFEEFDHVTGAPTMVLDHDHGAWVRVPPVEPRHDGLDRTTHPGWDSYPDLHRLLLAARAIGAEWISLDSEATDVFPHLPTFGWWSPGHGELPPY